MKPPMQFPTNHARRDSEAGYVLLAVLFLTVVLLVSLAIAAPKIARSIQRDKDLETIHRGEQYRRALQLYYRQFGKYPTSMDQLVNTNNVRFLRQKYVDPETGKDDWKPIYYGQAHVRPLGFFGQPLAGVEGLMASATAGGGMASGMYAPLPATATDANGVPVSDNGSGAGTSPGASGSSAFGSGSTSAFGNNGSSSFGSSGGVNGGTFSMGGQNGASGIGANSGFGNNGQSGPGSPNGGIGSNGSSSAFGSGSDASTFGGAGPIVGFTLPVKKPSLVDYMQQISYDKWEFNYDPMVDQMQAANSLFGGGPAAPSLGPGGINGTQPGAGTAGGIGGTSPTDGSGPTGPGQTGPGAGGTSPGSNPTSPNPPQ